LFSKLLFNIELSCGTRTRLGGGDGDGDTFDSEELIVDLLLYPLLNVKFGVLFVVVREIEGKLELELLW
tara:strand:+ start:286 stop:492 length:207 start_codon:yes stop_codon:yes gene_type:complete